MQKVSVVMPCFNHARFLPDSVQAILAQTHPDLELIVVDDCSSDNSWDVIKSLAINDCRIKAIRHERNQGASKSRNDGLRAASGEFLGFCDADDIWEPGKLRFQLNLFQKSPEYDVVYCDSIIVDENGVPTGQCFSDLFPVPNAPSGILFPELIRRNFINIQSVLLRKECVQRAGYFDERVKWVEDWCYWVRLARHHRFLYSQELLARYRVHSHSTNQVHKRGYALNRVKVFRQTLREFTDLPRYAQADILFNMGAELRNLGKIQASRSLLWQAIKMSLTDIRTFGMFCGIIRRKICKNHGCLWMLSWAEARVGCNGAGICFVRPLSRGFLDGSARVIMRWRPDGWR